MPMCQGELPMTHKMAVIVGFLVLGCILAEAQAHDDYLLGGKPIGPLVWAPVHKSGVDKTYLSLGLSSDQPIDITATRFDSRNTPRGKKVTFEEKVNVKQG